MLDLKTLNESFDRINLIKTSGKLFEEFCEDCSESGIEKEDILDWLSEHEQLWNDCEKHFVQDPTWLSADELESFICEHEEACKDYAKAFGLSFDEEEELDESCTESFDKFLTEAKISPEDEHDSDLLRSIYTKINQKPRRNVEKRFTPEEKAVIDKYDIDLEREYWAGWGRGFNKNGYGTLYSINPKVNSRELFRPLDDDQKAINYADRARKYSTRPSGNYKYDGNNNYGDLTNQTFRTDKQKLADISRGKSEYLRRIKDLEAKISKKQDYIEAARKGKLQDVTEEDIKKAEASIRIANAELEAIKKEKPYFDSERKKAIDNFYKDRFGKTLKHENLLKKYGHLFEQQVILYENFNPSKKPLTEAKKDKILDQLDKEDYQLIKSIYPKSTMVIVGHPGNKKVFFIDYEHSGFGGYYHFLIQVFPKPKKWNDEGEEYREFFEKIPNSGEPISRKEGLQQEVAYLQSKYDRVLVIPQKKWLQIAQSEVPLDIDDTEPEEDEFNPPVKFYYGVYEIDEDNDELDHISDFDTQEEAIKFAKKQSFPTHIVFIPSKDPDDDPEIAEYIQNNAPYEAYETIWSSLDESFKKPGALKEDANKVTLFCELETYSRYAFDNRRRKVKVTGKDHLEALKKLVDKLNLYITSDRIEEEGYTFEDAIESISNTNGDGCDWITKLTDDTGNTFIKEEAYADDWEDLDEGKAFDFNKLNKKLHGNVKLKNESLLKENSTSSKGPDLIEAKSPKMNNVRRVIKAMDWNKPTFVDPTSSGYRLKWGGHNFLYNIDPIEAQKIIKEIENKTGIKCMLNRGGYLVVPYSDDTDIYEGKAFDFDKLNKKLHGNIRL